MKIKYKKVGIVVKPHNGVVLYLKKAIQVLETLGVEIILEKIAAELIGLPGHIERENIADSLKKQNRELRHTLNLRGSGKDLTMYAPHDSSS